MGKSFNMELITPLMGTWLQIGHPVVAEIAAYKDFNWICVDLEHSPTTIETMGNMFRAIKAVNRSVMLTVRVPDHDPKTISRCLDVGAECLIVPQVNTYEQADNIVKAAKYPVIGKRGCGYTRSNKYGAEPITNTCTIIVQIEHYKAMGELEAMMMHPHIDGAFIGPLDMIGSLPSKKQITKTMDEITTAFVQIISKYRKYAGIHIIEPNPTEVARIIRAGYNFIALGVDTSLLSKSFSDILDWKEE